MRNNKILWVGAALLTGGALFFIAKRRKKTLDNNTITDSLPSTSNSIRPVNYPILPKGNDQFPLKFGSEGDNVRKWQQYLQNKLGKTRYPDKWITGLFREQTEKATIDAKGVKEVSKAMFDQVSGKLINTASNNAKVSLNPLENAAKGWKFALQKLIQK